MMKFLDIAFLVYVAVYLLIVGGMMLSVLIDIIRGDYSGFGLKNWSKKDECKGIHK